MLAMRVEICFKSRFSLSRFAPKGYRNNIPSHQHRNASCLHSDTEHQQCQRRNSVQCPHHLVGRHLAVLQTPDLTAFAQALESECKFPALRLVDEEQVFLAVGVAHRGAKDVEVFGGLDASLEVKLVRFVRKRRGEINLPRFVSTSKP
jgi:hypothetical protein